MGKEEQKEEFKKKIESLIEEFIELSPKDIKDIFDYFSDGTLTIVHKVRNAKKEPKDIIVKRFYAEYLLDDGIWFKKGDRRHGYLAADGQYYVNLNDGQFNTVKIYFFNDDHFNESFKLIEDEA